MVVFSSIGTTAILACVVLMPWIKITIAEAHTEKLKSIYSSGLLPCGQHLDDLDALIQSYQPQKVALEIREFPALANEAHVVQIAGPDLYSFEFKPLFKENGKGPPELHTEVPPKIAVATISPETSQELSLLLAEDIRHAQPRQLNTVDGVAFTFIVPGVGCAYTVSPPSSSRAGKLTDIYFALLKHATITNAGALQESNHNILAAARALQVR